MSTSLRAAGPPLRPATSDVPAGLAGRRTWTPGRLRGTLGA
ncbi:MAG TPA: hypothetical protein VNE67_14345 [Acetobacteraceae bacterium]|nr:hypothetical protein [Acetobacteraceae bacterium]